MVPPPTSRSPRLVRPSQLARFWELHPRTVQLWILDGRLPAIRSPGNHFRLRVADVRAFCERSGMPVPPFVSPPPARAVVMTASASVRRGLARALKSLAVHETAANPFEALVAVASAPAALVALDVGASAFDAASAIRALKRAPASAGTAIVAFEVPSAAQASALEKAGADRVLTPSDRDELVPVLRGLLS